MIPNEFDSVIVMNVVPPSAETLNVTKTTAPAAHVGMSALDPPAVLFRRFTVPLTPTSVETGTRLITVGNHENTLPFVASEGNADRFVSLGPVERFVPDVPIAGNPNF